MESMYVIQCKYCMSLLYEYHMSTFDKCKFCSEWEEKINELQSVIDYGWECLHRQPQCSGLMEEIENIERFSEKIKDQYMQSLVCMYVTSPLQRLSEHIPYFKERMTKIENGNYDHLPLFYEI